MTEGCSAGNNRGKAGFDFQWEQSVDPSSQTGPGSILTDRF